MKLAYSFLAITCCVLAVAFTNGQQYDGLRPWNLGNYFFRSGNAFGNQQQGVAEERFFLTQYLTLSTSTFTTTITSLSTCTTSTSALVLCSPSGRRRRSFPDGLLYNEKDEDVFLPFNNR